MTAQHKALLVNLDRDWLEHAGFRDAFAELTADVQVWSAQTGVQAELVAEQVPDPDYCTDYDHRVTRYCTQVWLEFESDLDYGLYRMSLGGSVPVSRNLFQNDTGWHFSWLNTTVSH
jgi:hypothetical protein